MEVYIPRPFKSPTQSFFLFGPRGTGKSTYLRKSFADALWIDLLKPDEFRKFSAKSENINLIASAIGMVAEAVQFTQRNEFLLKLDGKKNFSQW